MTDTNKEKETFESYWNKNFKQYDDGNDEQMFHVIFEEVKKFKQLHDEAIHNCAVNLDSKDKQIAELQAELEIRKGKRLYNNASWDERDKLNNKIIELQAEILRLKNIIKNVSRK